MLKQREFSVLNRLLNNLTHALKSSGVDVSQASISVQLDIAKQTNSVINSTVFRPKVCLFAIFIFQSILLISNDFCQFSLYACIIATFSLFPLFLSVSSAFGLPSYCFFVHVFQFLCFRVHLVWGE